MTFKQELRATTKLRIIFSNFFSFENSLIYLFFCVSLVRIINRILEEEDMSEKYLIEYVDNNFIGLGNGLVLVVVVVLDKICM
jgi:hypothetical protein